MAVGSVRVRFDRAPVGEPSLRSGRGAGGLTPVAAVRFVRSGSRRDLEAH